MPKVSVIIPNYNHAPDLKERIDSILLQTFQDFEIIVLDDNSTDDSRKIIEAYRSHPKVKTIVYNEENSGNTFKQWDFGIGLAQGDYIWIAESDDWCEPSLLQHLVEGIEKDDTCVISYCQSYCVVDGAIRWQSTHHKLSEMLDGHDFIERYLVPDPAIFNASMALWRKEKYRTIAKDFISMKLSGDWLFWIVLAQTGKVNINGRLLNYFRKHGNDVSSGAYGSGINFVEAAYIINKLYREKLINDNIYARAFKKHFKVYWLKRSYFSKEMRAEIDQLFYNPASPKASLLSVRLSALWKRVKQGKI